MGELAQDTALFTISAAPAVYIFLYYFVLKLSDDDRIDLLYTVSGEWAMLFLYSSLALRPFADICAYTQFAKVTVSQSQLLVICFVYSLLHLYAYLRYTLKRMGYTVNAFWTQINKKKYILYGVVAFVLLSLTLVMRSKWKRFPPYLCLGFAVYHIMVRGWVRKRTVRLAASAPYIAGALYIYNLLRDAEIIKL